MADCVPERAGALAQKTGNRLHVRNFLCGYPPDVLEDSNLWTPRRRLREVLGIERLHERGEVGGEIPHLDFCLRRPVAAKQVEEQGNAHIVGVLEPRGVDNNGPVWITRQCIEGILADRGRSASGESALQHDLHAVIRTQPARCGSLHLAGTTWRPICPAVPKARPGLTGLAVPAQDRRWSSTPFRAGRVSRAISRPLSPSSSKTKMADVPGFISFFHFPDKVVADSNRVQDGDGASASHHGTNGRAD